MAVSKIPYPLYRATPRAVFWRWHAVPEKHDLFPGNGQISWEGFADALQDIGYSGLYNFEVPGERSSFPGIHELKLKYALALGRHLFG